LVGDDSAGPLGARRARGFLSLAIARKTEAGQKRTPVAEVAKAMKRTEAAVRQKAKTIGVGLGHPR
jgi:hypothetical protein